MAKVEWRGNTLSSPPWMGDFGSREHILPVPAKLDPAQFLNTDAVVVTVGAGGAALGATSVPVAALSGPIPSGTVLRFSVDEFATLSAPAALGATSIAVEALVNALEAADVATYGGTGKKTVPSGTLIGRTIAERDLATAYGPAATTDDEIFLTCFDVPDVTIDNDVELYRHQGLVKENFLPGFAASSSGLKDKIRALYRCVRGVD